MMKALLSLRFRALFAGLTKQGRQKKKQSKGMTVLFIFLYLYLIAVICGVMGMTFLTLCDAYHPLGLDWLYFAMAGMMALALSVFGSVFTTQSQLYDANDNALLLSMPIPPAAILFSRMVPLLALNLLFAGIVMVPATVVYGIRVGFSLITVLAQLIALLAVVLLAQAIACLLGWGLHLLLSRMNKSLASMLYMVVFLGVYFAVYSQASNILNTIAANAGAIAGAFQTWVWPLYAMGVGSTGKLLFIFAFLAVCAGIFAIVYIILSATFLRTATMQRSRRARKLRLHSTQVKSPMEAIIGKEWKKFLGCPVYLTNMGLGIILTAALPVAGIFLRKTLAELTELPIVKPYLPLFLCAMLAFTVSTCCISTPSVSLEGKNIWILKSMPVASKDILLAKLRLHCRACVPVTVLSGAVLAITYGCGIADILLTAIVPGLLAALNGLVGMVAGLQWARLDYISEAYPCKQSVAVMVSMFSMMGIPLVLGLIYVLLLLPYVSGTVFLVLCAAVLAALCLGLYQLLLRWGVKKWDSL